MTEIYEILNKKIKNNYDVKFESKITTFVV